MPIRVLLVDDHKIVRDGLRALIEKLAHLQVAGEADDGKKAVEMAVQLHPDVVVMDLTLPRLNGIEATSQILKEVPGVKVVALSMHSDRRSIVGMLQAGAAGYLMKDCSFDELDLALRSVVAGGKYLCSMVTVTVVEDYLRQLSFYGCTCAESGLTRREREVLQLIAAGRSTRQTAESLRISIKTVESHRQNIMDKTGIHSVAELTKLAIRMNLAALDA
ncbi:response regulator transcription factor [bacterium]|nr:response regulator transcription factor [bacterium]